MHTVDFPKNITSTLAPANENMFHDEEQGVKWNNHKIYTTKCDCQWWRCYYTTPALMASEPDSSQVAMTEPQKQGVPLPSSWFSAMLRPDHSVLQIYTSNSRSIICHLSGKIYCTVSTHQKFHCTKSAQFCWPNMTTEHAAAAIAVHWTFLGSGFATHSCQLLSSITFTDKHIFKIAEVSLHLRNSELTYRWMTVYISRQLSKTHLIMLLVFSSHQSLFNSLQLQPDLQLGNCHN